jgi:tRNA(Arg) A34 adenosine deaminase TadA
MMTNEELMLQAIEEAKKSSEPLKCGVVIAKDGEIVTKTHNEQRETSNATAHAEIIAIKEAGQKLGRKNLDDCVIYCTCEPCTMCLSAVIFAKIPKLYFGTTLKNASPDHMPINLSSDELLKTSSHKIEIIPDFMRRESEVLLAK